MKFILLISVIYTSSLFAGSISGTINVQGNVPKGALYIFAKKFDGSVPMQIAVKRVKDPKFPYQFELSEKHQMMEGEEFKGPFKVTARISPSGSALDKSGVEVSTTEAIKMGDKDIKLLLK